VLPLVPAILAATNARRFVGCALHSLAVDLPPLRRSHAGCRAAFRRATLPQISAPFRPVRSMSPHPQPRISLVLRHAQPPVFAVPQNTILPDSPGAPMHLATMLLSANTQRRRRAPPSLVPSKPVRTGSATYKSHSPGGRLPASRCIRSARKQHLPGQPFAHGRFRYSPNRLLKNHFRSVFDSTY